MVIPYNLIWDGDYNYLTGFCDERDAVRTFRVYRITNRPEVLQDIAVSKPDEYDVSKYTTEVFRMFTTDETTQVGLVCDNKVMKSVVENLEWRLKQRVLEKIVLK